MFLPSQGLGPSIYLACPFFLTAAALETGISCPTPPTGEITHPDGANVVEFEDPPGLKGRRASLRRLLSRQWGRRLGCQYEVRSRGRLYAAAATTLHLHSCTR